MEPTSAPPEKKNQLKRWGPLIAIVAIIAVVGAVIAITSGGDDDSGDEGQQAGSGVTIQTEQGNVELPEGVLPFSVAEEEGIDVDWPDTCDTDRGTAAVPTFFAPECFAPFEGDNGGATDQGVTEDTIKVVLYQGPEDDPIIDAIAGAVSDDTNADTLETYQGYMDYFETYYETYGRKVELIPFQGTGTALDEVAARAEHAVKIAQEIQPFAVWGAPALTSAFADELAAQHILHLGLAGGGEQPSYYEERDPYMFQIGMGTGQARQHATQYICNRLAGEPASHAGDEALRDQERKFGLIYIETGPESAVTVDDFKAGLGECDVELADIESYTNPLDVSSVAPSVIAKMKDAGVTSVIVTGDPLTPATWTETATEQDYFPEWVVAGAPLVDTAIFGRTYDQQQWAHAFGISAGSARQDPKVASSRALYNWFNCKEPAADDTVELVYGSPAVFYATLQGVGPNLTRKNFRDTIFAADPTTRGLTNPSLSWGEPSKGRWDEVDYQGVDDATEIWWNPDLEGPDESGTDGQGLWEYVDGGKRYLADEWDEGESGAFQEEGSVTIYEKPPPDEAVPEYPRPCEGG